MIELRVLGAVELRGAEGAALLSVLSHPKRVAVLTYLALSAPERFVSRDRLVAVFWPESEESRARNSLSQVLRGLRRSLGERVIVNRGNQEVGLSLEHLRCDALAFREAVSTGDHQRVVDLFRGDLLEGQHLIEDPAFELWLDGQRRWYRERAATSAWHVARTHLEHEEPVSAERVAQWALELVCTDESEVEGFVAALAVKDRAAAVNFFERFSARLQDELDLEPSERLRGLMQTVLGAEAVGSEPAHASTVPGAAMVLPTRREARDPRRPDPLRRTSPPIQVVPPPKRHAVRRGAWSLVLWVLAVSVGYALLRPRDDLIPDLVAVMPLEDQSGAPDFQQFGERVAGQLARLLLETHLVQVVAMEATRAAVEANGGDAVRRVADATGAGTVLAGSFRLTPDTFQLQVQIIDARDLRVRSSPQASGTHIDPWRTVGALSERVLGAFEARFGPTPNEAWERDPPKYHALVAYRAAREQIGHGNPAGAVESLRGAMDMDPGFTPALWLAQDAHWALGEYETADSLLAVLEGQRGSLDSLGSVALDTRRARSRGDLLAVLEGYRRRAELDPDDPVAWYELGRASLDANRPGEAVVALERSDPDLWLSRDASAFHEALTAAYHMVGDHERELRAAVDGRERHPHLLATLAQEVRARAALGQQPQVESLLRESLALAPSEGRTQVSLILEGALELRAHGYRSASDHLVSLALDRCADPPPEEAGTETLLWHRAVALYVSGQPDEARAVASELAFRSPEDLRYKGLLGVLSIRLGDAEAIDRISSELAEMAQPYLYGRNTFWLARMAAEAGDGDRAVALLRGAHSRGYPFGIGWHRDVSLESLRGHPGFAGFLEPGA